MTVKIEYPSDAFPGPLRFRLLAPDGWVRVLHPDAAVAIRDPQETNGFHANIVVTTGRVVGEIGLEDLADRSIARGQQLGGKLVKREHRPLAGLDSIWTAMVFPSPDGTTPTMQLAATVLVARSDELSEVLTLTAACAAEDMKYYTPSFRKCFDSLQISL